MLSYCLKRQTETCAPEDYQQIDVDKIWTTSLRNIIMIVKNVHELRGAGVYCYSN